jgi:hypothetical protein
LPAGFLISLFFTKNIVNRYDTYISEYLTENREVALEKIGIIKISTAYPDSNETGINVDFTYDKKAFTSPELINFIAEKTGKSKLLIASDLESHLTQAREYINIGKTYEILNAGLIKANNSGEYEFILFSNANKSQKTHSQPVKSAGRSNARSAVQFFTFLIVLAIVAGMGWEGYRFFIKPKAQKAPQDISNTNQADTIAHGDTASGLINTGSPNHALPSFNNDDTVLVRYIFETTDSLVRAKKRIAQLKSFGNPAGLDSFQNNRGKSYSLFIYKRTKIADTLAVKDSLAKFLQKTIRIQIEPTQ